MDEKQILIIHPNDKTTRFLDRIKNHLIELFSSEVHHFNIYPNDQSHQECLKRISLHPESGLIIFLGHGRKDTLYGSKGKFYEGSEYISQVAKEEHPDYYYYNDNFIHEGNIDVFAGKKIICLACNSNSKIGDLAIEKGAKSFLGFGNIPTSLNEFEDKEKIVTNELVTKMKSELNYIMKTSLALGISNGLTFEQLIDYIKFITNQRMTNILMNEKEFKERFFLADQLYFLKNDVKVIGNRKLKLLD